MFQKFNKYSIISNKELLRIHKWILGELLADKHPHVMIYQIFHVKSRRLMKHQPTVYKTM